MEPPGFRMVSSGGVGRLNKSDKVVGREGFTMSKRVVAKSGTEPVLSFARATEWRDWLASHHATSSGVLLRIPKKGDSRAITYAEAVEVALAWGWIDSQKRAL